MRPLASALIVAAAAVTSGLLSASSAPAGLSGSFSYKFVNKPIPDGKGARIVSFTYEGAGKIADANAFVRVTHPRTKDLEIALKHKGISVKLSNGDTAGDKLGHGRCKEQPQSATDFPDFLIFNDEADTAIADGTSPYADLDGYIPRAPLTAFDGERLGGKWKLVLGDTKDGKAGRLKCAQLAVEGAL